MLRSLRDRAVFIHGRAADEPPEAVVLKGVGADRLAVLCKGVQLLKMKFRSTITHS